MIRLTEASDVTAYAAYLSRHIAESGQDGDPVYAVQSDPGVVDPAGFAERVTARWALPSHLGGWQRTFVALVGDVVVGHCELESERMTYSRHRAELSLGVLRSHRRRGLGADLLDAALGWARAHPTVVWVDLGVFVPNPIAVAMYDRAGFERTGLITDRYRVGDTSLDELTMTLNVDNAGR